MTLKRRVNRLMGGGRIVLWDSFTDADDAALTQHAPDGGFVWSYPSQGSNPDAVVASNRLTMPTTASALSGHGQAGSRLRRRRGEVSCDVVRVAAANASAINAGVLFGLTRQGLPRRGYWARYTLSSTVTAWQLIRDVTATQVGSNVVQVLTQDQVYRLRMAVRRSVVLIFVDDVLILRADDPQTAFGSVAGIRYANPGISGPALRLDIWLCTR